MEKPKLLLLGEPTNGLDPQGIIKLRGLIRSLAEGGVTVFMASHLLTEVEQVCDRVLLVRQGVVVKEIDQKESSRPALRLTVSSNSDMAPLFEWARTAGASVEAAGDSPLSVEILVEKRTPEVVRELVEACVNVEELVRIRPSLEKEFLELVAEKG
jgi:ABC-2 type transport system ATP-binding protein